MFKDIEISPEVARLIQRGCGQKQLPIEGELARYVVEESVLGLEPELELILDADAALAEIAPLARATGVNDVVINGHHVHVCVLDGEGQVKIKNVLIGTDYLSPGTLVVKLDNVRAGSVVGHVDEKDWQIAVANKQEEEETRLDYRPSQTFDLPRFLTTLKGQPILKGERPDLKADDYLTFMKDRRRLPLDKQRQIVSALLSPAIRENVALLADYAQDRLAEILRDSAVWSARVEQFRGKLSTKFPSLSHERIEDAILRAGEISGAQTDLVQFRQAVALELGHITLAGRLTKSAQAKISLLFEQINSGVSSLNAVKTMIENQLTLDLAQAISLKREHFARFTSTTAEEFGLAFKSLSLRPAYSTHSAKETVELAAVDEALVLLEAGTLAEQIRELEF